jgi:cellulose synthase operon protein C
MMHLARRPRAFALALTFSAGLACNALAQPDPHPLREAENKDVTTPNMAEPVLRLLEASYLTENERKDLRIFHGVSRPSDLDAPQRSARAALIRGAYGDESLKDPSVDAVDRAEALVFLGEADAALPLLEGLESPRAVRLRAQALEMLGRPADAAAAIAPLVEQLRARKLTSADDLLEGIRALMLRTRLAPQEEPAGGDFRRINELLAVARDDLGRLHWPTYIVEAELLYEKDNASAAGQAVRQALEFNPSSAQAWFLMGRVAVESFNFEGAEKVAEKLRALGGDDSPLAAIILARAALRQNDPDGALEFLSAPLKKHPRMRPLLALQAAATALQYDFDKADARLAEFDELSPNSPLAYYEVGRALSEARQYESAGKYLRIAAERAPYWSEPVIELGLMAVQAGQDLEAGDALRKAAALDPFNIRAGNTLALVKELAGYARVESDHFIVRYKPGEDDVLAAEMLVPLERIYARVTGGEKGGIDHEPPIKTVIDLMPDKRSFGVRIAGVTRIHTMAASTGPCIAMESPRAGPRQSVGIYDWPRVVQHEFTHTVTLSRTNNRIPHWFTEAAAVYLEDAPRAYSTCKLLQGALESDSLFDLRQINLAFVRPKKASDRTQAYAQGHWMYEYIVDRYGSQAPLELMDRYAAGERQEAAFRTVLGVDTATFLEQFKEWATDQVAEWGLSPRPGVPTIAEIVAEEQEAGNVGADGKLSITVVDRWLDKHPMHPGLLEHKLRLTLQAAGNLVNDDVVAILERYAVARPVDPLPHQFLAQHYLGKPEDRFKAIPHLEFLDAREQNATTYAQELARLYLANGDLEHARVKAERATTIAPYSAPERELAATIALQASDFQGARRHIAALAKIESDRAIHQRRLEAVEKRLGEELQVPARGG